ncbi:unnamed protein product [Adineta steineri]|uniref:Uncharacterized protein n=1 Tax=Adineta steineri TaxID=433720 RepID=A0A815QTU2_9BILA|nr:unnamed protein product [Adineta steineri]
MADDIPFEKKFHRNLSNQPTYSSSIRSSSLTSYKQYRCRDNQVCPDYKWILKTDEKRLTQQKNLEERQKAIIHELSSDQTSNQTSIDYEVDFLPGEPVLVCVNARYFDITNNKANINELSIQLAQLASKMLDKIQILSQKTHLPFNKQFRLELRPVSFYNSDPQLINLWELRLNLDPIVWFDYFWQKTEQQKDFLHTARMYVDKYRHFVKYEYLSESKFEPLASERHCRYQTTCNKDGGKYAHALHSTLICLENGSMLRDDGLHKCGQFFVNSTIAMQWPVKSILNSQFTNDNHHDYGLNFHWQTSSFVFTSKRETVRDLVMYATPPWHITNRKMIHLPLFWSTVIYTCHFLYSELRKQTNRDNIQWPVNAIALNFGKWETGSSYSTHAIDCHAHTHFLLTKEFISECNETFFQPLQGRQNAPPDYLNQNAEILERERLLSCEIQTHQQTIYEIKEQVDDIQINMKKMITILESIFLKEQT